MSKSKKILVRTHKNIIEIGNGLGLHLPLELVELMKLEKGTELVLSLEEGRHGQYAAFWKSQTQLKRK